MIWLQRKGSRVDDVRTMATLFPSADALAHADGVRDAGAEHLLIASFELADGSARRAFQRAGADPDQFAAAVAGQHAEALESVGMGSPDVDLVPGPAPSPSAGNGPHRGSPSSHQLFRKVVRLVRAEHSQLYGAYFVLVAAQTEHGTVARALKHLGLDRTRLAAAARAELDLLNSPAP